MEKIKKYRFLSVLLIVLIISGCASLQKNYGKLKKLPKDQSEMIIQDLIDKWEDYDIYYAEVGGPSPLGIMFDPKNNDTTLVADMWKKVEDKETLLEIIKWIKHGGRFNEILGPDGLLYGYLYYSYGHSNGHVTLKMVGDKKMYVFKLEQKLEHLMGR